MILATYNGSPFLLEQLNSIKYQTLPPSRLLVSDDLSSDDTVDIIKNWSMEVCFPVFILPPSSTRLGCTANFEKLLKATSFNYVMFADQDDIWDCSKAQRMLEKLSLCESIYSKNTPLVVHSDLRLISEDRSLISPSYFKYQGLSPSKNDYLAIAFQNIVTGCSCLVNRSCISYVLPFPADAILHDWWIALVTSYCGKIIFLPEATLSYRQHNSNLIGAAGIPQLLFRRFTQLFTDVDPLDSWLGIPLRQLYSFSTRYLTTDNSSYKLVQILFHPNPLFRLYGACRLRLSKHGPFRTLILYIIIVFWSPSRGSRHLK